jgi:endonuclease YncB( thermonuclease family)
MLGWGRKSDGADIRAQFERRREQARRGILGMGRAIGTGIQAARAATGAGVRAVGAAVLGGAHTGRRAVTLGVQRITGGAALPAAVLAGFRPVATAALGGARAGFAAAALMVQRLLNGTSAIAVMIRQGTGTARGALAGILARPATPGMVAAAGSLALGLGIGRTRGAGLDGEAAAMLLAGAALLALLLPMAMQQLAGRWPGVAWPMLAMAAVSVAVFAAAALWSQHRHAFSLAGIAGGREVAGPATAVAGDLLKVGGTTVRLAGIEAPERVQLCGRDGGRWRCAEAAQSALARLVAGRPVRCRLAGTDGAGRRLGVCALDRVDINADLVRQGFVFAAGGTSGRYAAQESEARTARSGLWIGEPLRPAEIRARAWEEARRRAPDGCPIKGQVTGEERVYVLPGTPAYDRARVQPARGDRWFCSEQDAAAAGFKGRT